MYFVYLLAAASCYLMITGYAHGPAATNGYDCTGAETGLSNPAGCNSGGGCHASSATAGITIAIELDSTGGVPTTHYKGGMNYTVKLKGTNTTSSSLPQFGFQMGSIQGSVAVTTPINAGTWNTPFPTNTHYATPSAANGFVVGLVEHLNTLSATTGSGGSGTTYVETFNWTAPVAGTGGISIWAALNAVNGNGTNDAGDKWNTNHVAISEWPMNTAVASIEQNIFDMNIYPNPANNYASLDYTVTASATVNVALYDISGKKISDVFCEYQNSGQHHQLIDLAAMSLNSGVYFILMKTGDKAITRKLIVQ